MEKKLVLVLLDACRTDYISEQNTPFLYKLKEDNRYYKSLIPGFGFCDRTEILVGKKPLDSGYFTAFGRSVEESPYNKLRIPFEILGKIETFFSSVFFSKLIRRIIWEIMKNKNGTYYPFRIPLKKLSNFSLTEDGPLNLINTSQDSLYKIASRVFKEASTSLDSKLSGSDEDRLNLIVEKINESYDFYPTYVSTLDAIGHNEGPNSRAIQNGLKEIDAKLKVFYNKLQIMKNPPVVVFCGDHGMSQITYVMNIEREIFRIFKDKSLLNHFDMFLDSTMARFWFDKQIFNEIKKLKDLLESKFKDKGFFLFQNQYKDYGIPESNLYGDCIWICNDGVLISPDYFSPANKKINGMHGYQPLSPQHYGFAIFAGHNIQRKHFNKPMPLISIYKDIKNFLLDFKDVNK